MNEDFKTTPFLGLYISCINCKILWKRTIMWNLCIYIILACGQFSAKWVISVMHDRVTPGPENIVFIEFRKVKSWESSFIYIFLWYMGEWRVNATCVATRHFTEIFNYIMMFTSICEISMKDFLFDVRKLWSFIQNSWTILISRKIAK